jgi:hypothetical protein
VSLSRPPRRRIIDILVHPPGASSPHSDERCLTYCSQSIAGRIGHNEPWCRSICIRRVFAHEVRNVINYKRHSSVQPNGEAKYPLPPEGRRSADFYGGTFSDGEERQSSTKDAKHWEEGWYIWITKSRLAASEKLDLMSCDLERQTNWLETKEKRMRDWKEWQEKQQKAKQDGHIHEQAYQEPSPPDIYEHSRIIQPPKPYPDTS